jgi:hypothetical protein
VRRRAAKPPGPPPDKRARTMKMVRLALLLFSKTRASIATHRKLIDVNVAGRAVGIFQRVGVTFTPVYKCIHIYENLSSLTEFENYYQYTRQVRTTSRQHLNITASWLHAPLTHPCGVSCVCVCVFAGTPHSCKRTWCSRVPPGRPSWRAGEPTSPTFTRSRASSSSKHTCGTPPKISSRPPRYANTP